MLFAFNNTSRILLGLRRLQNCTAFPSIPFLLRTLDLKYPARQTRYGSIVPKSWCHRQQFVLS